MIRACLRVAFGVEIRGHRKAAELSGYVIAECSRVVFQQIAEEVVPTRSEDREKVVAGTLRRGGTGQRSPTTLETLSPSHILK